MTATAVAIQIRNHRLFGAALVGLAALAAALVAVPMFAGAFAAPPVADSTPVPDAALYDGGAAIRNLPGPANDGSSTFRASATWRTAANEDYEGVVISTSGGGLPAELEVNVSGKTYRVFATAETTVLGPRWTKVDVGQIKVGDTVHVRGALQTGDGSTVGALVLRDVNSI